jgi:hypothetical protein
MIDLNKLKETRQEALAELQLDQSASQKKIIAEYKRDEACKKVLAGLEETLMAAAKRGEKTVALIRVKPDWYHPDSWDGPVHGPRTLLFFHKDPSKREDLHCPAYERLWDNLAMQGLRPHFTKKDSNHYISVDIA